ncbi:hypothetical protein CEXT_119051 [Caerostris extrusa]|uniref:Uncharacterized protein n=1 Tax=Caerostris extrusa TaxID=172846 RepID=A0AAV4QL91_CAEEX|nr:hypothetical protein CEXT_119051 [Caerostris extrusa]
MHLLNKKGIQTGNNACLCLKSSNPTLILRRKNDLLSTGCIQRLLAESAFSSSDDHPDVSCFLVYFFSSGTDLRCLIHACDMSHSRLWERSMRKMK